MQEVGGPVFGVPAEVGFCVEEAEVEPFRAGPGLPFVLSVAVRSIIVVVIVRTRGIILINVLSGCHRMRIPASNGEDVALQHRDEGGGCCSGAGVEEVGVVEEALGAVVFCLFPGADSFEHGGVEGGVVEEGVGEGGCPWEVVDWVDGRVGVGDEED